MDFNKDCTEQIEIAEKKIKEEACRRLDKIDEKDVNNNDKIDEKDVNKNNKIDEEDVNKNDKIKENKKSTIIRVPTDPLQGLETDSKGRIKMKIDSDIYVEELSQDAPVEIDLCEIDRPIKGQRKCCISFASPPISNIEKRENFIMNEYLNLFLSQYTEIVLKHVSSDFKLNKDDVLEKYGFMKRVNDSLENFNDSKWKETKENHDKKITNNFFSANINDMLVMYNQYRTDNMAELREMLDNKYPRECFEYAIKIRGSYGTSAKANKRCDELMKKDKHNKIYVADVGAWLPVCPPDSLIGRQRTIDKKLNNLMWSHRKNILYADRFFRERINEQIEDKISKTLHSTVPPNPLDNTVNEETNINELINGGLGQQEINRNNHRRVRKRKGKRN